MKEILKRAQNAAADFFFRFRSIQKQISGSGPPASRRSKLVRRMPFNRL
jgi:hypothetical protein